MQRLNLSSIDWILFVPISILLFFSLSTLFSIDQGVFRSQLFFLIVSLFALFFFSQFNLAIIKYYSIYIYFISLLILLILLGVGIETRGSVRWFEVFGFGIQFSELLKPFLAISLASYLTNLKSMSLKAFLNVLLLMAPVVLLIFLQPDLGNALIYVVVVLGSLLVTGFSIRYFLFGFLMWCVSLPFFWLILKDYQRHRILTFIDPSRDPLGTSYNAIQAVIAVGSGMIVGRGLGQGTQAQLRFLPERHTDFIFATISEQLGFIGSLVIIACFIFIFYRLIIFMRNSDDKFSRIFTLIVFMIIFVHFTMNVGMNIGILPVVGITLPFVSYGGSSLLSNFILIGLLFSVSRKKRKDALEIR